LSTAGIDYLQGLREKGISPSHGGEARPKRGKSQKSRSAARKEWNEANPGRLEEEKERFIKEIQPMLQAFTITKIMRICHCSPTYASLIKNGRYIPHPAFYSDLEKVIKQ
jgi:hypothetical protein